MDPDCGPPDGDEAWVGLLPSDLVIEYCDVVAAGRVPVREVLKEGFWDRRTVRMAQQPGFGHGGAADRLAGGPVLAELADRAQRHGLGGLTEDELIGVMRAGRRIASWSAALELSAVGELMERRFEQEAAGQAGVAEHASDEIAAALTLTARSAEQLADHALALARLPATRAALTVGDIDLPRAKVIIDETGGLDPAHAARVEAAVIAHAGGQTTGQLRAAVRRAVIAADPDAARRRKDEALERARVERWNERTGTAGLAGRDLPTAAALTADHHLSDLASQLQQAGHSGTLDALRAQVFLALLAGRDPLSAPLATGTGTTGTGATSTTGVDGKAGCAGAAGAAGGPGRAGADRAGVGTAGVGASGARGAAGAAGRSNRGGADTAGVGPIGVGASGTTGAAGAAGGRGGACAGAAGTGPSGQDARGGVAGVVNLTMPLLTWLGLSQSPGDIPGYGPLDAGDARDLATVLAAHPASRWCLTLTGSTGHPLAHGCARHGGPPAQPDHPSPSLRTSVAGPAPGPGSGPGPGAGGGPGGARAGPPQSPWPTLKPATLAWLAGIHLRPLARGTCDHARATASYRPPPSLAHLIRIRQATCSFPGCRRPATRCDLDHTLAWGQGGRTCECGLSPLCRRHHRAKQSHGWRLEQPEPGTLVWTLPSGRAYTTAPTSYPGG